MQVGNGESSQERARVPWRAACPMFMVAALVQMAPTSCDRAPSSFRLYDLAGTRLLHCTSVNNQQQSFGKGALNCDAVDGETYRGEWMTVEAADEPAPQGFFSMPSITNETLASSWSWARSLGVDLDNTKGKFGIFLLYGDRGTVIDGIFVFNSCAHGFLGAARDNRGRRYKLMG